MNCHDLEHCLTPHLLRVHRKGSFYNCNNLERLDWLYQGSGTLISNFNFKAAGNPAITRLYLSLDKAYRVVGGGGGVGGGLQANTVTDRSLARWSLCF